MLEIIEQGNDCTIIDTFRKKMQKESNGVRDIYVTEQKKNMHININIKMMMKFLKAYGEHLNIVS